MILGEDTCLEKERVLSKMIPRKVGMGLKRRRELNKNRWGWRLAWLGSTEKKEVSHLLGLREKEPVLRPALQSNQSSLCGLDRMRNRGGGEGPEGHIVNIKRAADGREARRSLKREKRTGPRTDPCGTPRRTGKERLL